MISVSKVLQLYDITIFHTCEECRQTGTDFGEEKGSLSFFRMSRVLKSEVSSKRAFGNPKVEVVNPSHFEGGNTIAQYEVRFNTA